MNSTVPRPVPPVARRFIFRFRPFAVALVVMALMAGGAAAQRAPGDAESVATQRLFEAVYDNNLGAVQASIAAGADINATNELGLMPVDVAVDRGHFRVAHFLLSIRNFRRTKRAEAAPPPPLPIAPATPAAGASKTLPERSPIAATAPRAAAPPAPWPADRPNPFDPATTARSANLPLVGPVFGPGTTPPGTAPPVAARPPQRPVAAPAPTAPVEASPASLPRVGPDFGPGTAPPSTEPPVAAAPSQHPVAAPAPAATVEASSEPEPAEPGFFSRLTRLFRPGGAEPAETAGAAPPSGTASDVASAANADAGTQEAEVPAKTAPRAREEDPRPAASPPDAAPPLASRKPTVTQTPPAATGSPFDPAAAAPGSALPVIGAILEPVAAPSPPKFARPASPAVTETAEPAPPRQGLFQRLAEAPAPGRQEDATEDPPTPELAELAEAPAEDIETKSDVAATDDSAEAVAAKDMETAAGAGESQEQHPTEPGFFRRLAKFFGAKTEIPDSDIGQTDQLSETTSPIGDPGLFRDRTTDTPEEADKDPEIEQALVEPPATLLPRSRSEGGKTDAAPGSAATPAPSPDNDPSMEAGSAAGAPESQADQRSLIQRLTEFFKPKAEHPADIADPTPTPPARAPSSPADALASRSIEGRGEVEREVEIEILPRPAAVKPAAVEPTAVEPTAVEPTAVEPATAEPAEAEKDIEVAAAPLDEPPAPTPSPEPATVQVSVEPTPTAGLFERLSRFLRPGKEAPGAAVEPTAPTELDPPVESTAVREQPATDLPPVRSDDPRTAPPPPAPTETAAMAEKPAAEVPNLEPPIPAAETPTGETNPFDPEAAPRRFNIPVIGEIYGPGSALPRPEPPRLVKAAPDPAPPVEVAEAAAAVAEKEAPATSQEPAPPATSVSLSETEKADESRGILDRLKGLFRPDAEGPSETPPTPVEIASAPFEPPPSAPQAGRSMSAKPGTDAPPAPAAEATPAPAVATEIPAAPSETAPPVPETAGATDEPAPAVGLFQRLANFLKPKTDQAVADETATKEEARAKERVETARLPARPASSVPMPPPPPRLLEGVILTLGETVRLGKDPGKGMAEAGRRQPCLKKREGALVFCVGPVDWPGEIEHHFDVSTFMYHGTQAIARYDKGEATSYYTLFKTDSFDAVVAYYERRFGRPTEIWERRVKPMASAPLPNPTMLWRSVDPATRTVSVLEVRKFDDARGGFPDMRRGAILLRREDTQPIFPRLSTLELMSVN